MAAPHAVAHTRTRFGEARLHQAAVGVAHGHAPQAQLSGEPTFGRKQVAVAERPLFDGVAEFARQGLGQAVAAFELFAGEFDGAGVGSLGRGGGPPVQVLSVFYPTQSASALKNRLFA